MIFWRYDDFRIRYITIGRSEIVYSPKPAVPEAYIVKWKSPKEIVKRASTLDNEEFVSEIHFHKGKFLTRTFSNRIAYFNPVTPDNGAVFVHYQVQLLQKILFKKKYGLWSNENNMLDIYNFIETQSLKRWNSAYTKIPVDIWYTYFHDLWRAILDVVKTKGHTLAWCNDSLRCRVA